jgi:hypothetical protein
LVFANIEKKKRATASAVEYYAWLRAKSGEALYFRKCVGYWK